MHKASWTWIFCIIKCNDRSGYKCIQEVKINFFTGKIYASDDSDHNFYITYVQRTFKKWVETMFTDYTLLRAGIFRPKKLTNVHKES